MLPLIRGYGAGSVFAYRGGRAIGAAEFLRDVWRLADTLPRRRHVVNLCADRYRFAVGLAAALVREQVSLLPPNETPGLLAQLAAGYRDAYCLTDAQRPVAPFATVTFPGPGPAGSAAPRIPVFPESQAAAILFTSGSTGEPLPHRKSWGGLVRTAQAEIDRFEAYARPGLAVLATVPPQHAYGLESTVLTVMQGGHALHAGRPFYPADIRDALAALPRPRILVTTPVHLRVLMAEADAPPAADCVICATAPLSPQLAAESEARFSAPLYEIYGCTEAGQVATRRTVEAEAWRALKDLVLRTDARGTWVKGGHVEAEVLLADVIELLGSRTFRLHGRTADLVNIAGKRTSLAHLNYHLNSIEGVRDGVFIVPEQEGDGITRLMAFVVAPGIAAEAVLNALRQRIDAAFLPRPLCVVEELPRNATGKLPRRALEELVTVAAGRAG